MTLYKVAPAQCRQLASRWSGGESYHSHRNSTVAWRVDSKKTYVHVPDMWMWPYLEKIVLQMQLKDGSQNETILDYRWALNPKTNVFMRDTQWRHTQGEGGENWRWRQRLELAVTSQGMPRAIRAGGGKEGSSPKAIRGSTVLPTPGFQTWGLQNSERINQYFKPPCWW